MSKSNISREALVKAAAQVRPAVSGQSYVPALTHIRFMDGWLTAYNDVTAIAVKGPKELPDCCLPGDTLIKALNGFTTSEIALTENDKEGSVLLTSGRSKMKLHSLPVKDFPFEWPEGDSAVVELDADVLRGIERCLISVGADPTHPAQMGVTMEADEKGRAVLFSTDNFTISRFQTKTEVDLPGDTPIILPTFFCEQVVLLSKALGKTDVDLCIFPGAIMAVIGNVAQVFTKMVDDLEPLNFGSMLSRYFKIEKVKNQLVPLPDGFDAALGRALLVLSNSSDKVTKVEVDDDSLKMSTSSDIGDANDSLKFDGEEFSDDPFYVDPSLVSRAAKVCDSVALLDKVLLMGSTDATFLHMIAHCSK